MMLRGLAVLISAIPLAAFAADQPSPKSVPLDCKVGPATRAYGGNPWLVYACSDGHSIALVSAPGSKAMPFVFILYWDSKQYRLSGEGTGDKEATDAAFGEIKALTDQDIALLGAEAVQMGQHKKSN